MPNKTQQYPVPLVPTACLAPWRQLLSLVLAGFGCFFWHLPLPTSFSLAGSHSEVARCFFSLPCGYGWLYNPAMANEMFARGLLQKLLLS